MAKGKVFHHEPLCCFESTVLHDLHSELKKTGIEQECKVKHLEEEKNAYIRKFSKDPEFIRSVFSFFLLKTFRFKVEFYICVDYSESLKRVKNALKS